MWVESKQASELDRLGFNLGKHLNPSEPVSLVQMGIEHLPHRATEKIMHIKWLAQTMTKSKPEVGVV